MLPVDDMLLFVDVVNCKSFTSAADKNEITAAAASKRISQLEKMLGVKLLKRTTRALALTDAGRLLHEHCQEMNVNLQGVVETVLEAHKKPKGKIKLAALENVSHLILAPLINAFLEEYPDIEIEINLEGALGPLPSIGDYDIAFRSGKLIDSSAISRLLFTHNYVVCASPVYLSKRGTPKTLEDLKHHNCVDCRHGHRERENVWAFFDGVEDHHVVVRGSIATDNALLVKHLALNHAALIYSPSFIVADDINTGKLVPVLTKFKTIENPIYLVHPYTTKNAPKRIKTFIDFVYKNIKVPFVKSKHLTQVA